MQSFPTERPIALSIDLTLGMVHVIAGDRGDTVVAVNPTDRSRSADIAAAEQTTVDLTNGTLTIRTLKRRGLARHLGPGRSGSIDVTVEVPRGSSLITEAGFADVRCDGEFADVDVKTGAGTVRLDRVGAVRVRTGVGQVTVETASGDAEIVTIGDVALTSVGGSADVNNRNGKTWIGRVGGSARIKSANGDVTIGDAGRDVTVKTANGDIRLGRIVRGAATIETACGSLEIGIADGTAAWVEADTRFGQIHNSLSPATDPGKSKETVHVRARTSIGDVLITRP